MLGGLGLDLDRGRERDELDRRLLPVDEDADSAQELRRLARVGGGQPAGVEHQVIEFLDGRFLRVLADEVGRDIELDRQVEALVLDHADAVSRFPFGMGGQCGREERDAGEENRTQEGHAQGVAAGLLAGNPQAIG